MTWVPGDITQAEDRCHRIGQHTCVNIHYLLVRGSIDEIMWDTVNVSRCARGMSKHWPWPLSTRLARGSAVR